MFSILSDKFIKRLVLLMALMVKKKIFLRKKMCMNAIIL